MVKKTSRAIETKERFKKAFFTLYAEKKIETITIKEVADLAGFNRGTFYIYYKGIYDLLQKTEQELIEEFAKRVEWYVKLYYYSDENNPDEKIFEEMYKNFLKNGEYFKVLNGENGDPRFRVKMKNIVKDAYRRHLKIDGYTKGSKIEYVLEYLAEANISLTQYWLENQEKDGQQVTIRDVGRIMNFVGMYGFEKAFKEFNVK